MSKEEDCLLLDSPIHVKRYGSEPFIKSVSDDTRNERSKSWGDLEHTSIFVGRRPKEVGSIANFPMQEVYVAKKEISETLLGRRTFHISWALYIIIFTLIGGIIVCAIDGIFFIDAWYEQITYINLM